VLEKCTGRERRRRVLHGSGASGAQSTTSGRNIMDTKVIEELARKLADSVPPGVRALQADMEKNFRALLEAGLARLNLVTREEFDVQQRVLERTREKLTALETRLGEFESKQSKPR
jgi:hypothetical protein